MIKNIQRIFIALVPAIFLAACSSGVTSSNAGGAGTNSGTTGLTMFMTVTPTGSPYVAGEDTNADGICDDFIRKSGFGAITITLQDPSGIYFSQNQGATFNSYTVSFQGASSNAPALSARTYTNTIVISLSRSTSPVTGTLASALLVDADTTLLEYSRKDSGSTNSYLITVTYRGNDFISGEPLTVVATATIEIQGCEPVVVAPVVPVVGP